MAWSTTSPEPVSPRQGAGTTLSRRPGPAFDPYKTEREEKAVFASLMRNAKGGIDDALGLVLEVSLFAIVFAAVLIGSATAQAQTSGS